MEEIRPLFSLSKFKCECVLNDALGVIGTHLSRTRRLLDGMESGGDTKRFRQVLASMERTFEELKRQNTEHFTFRADYARELVERVKVHRINDGGPLRTLPYTTGRERGEEEKEQTKKTRKKRKIKV